MLIESQTRKRWPVVVAAAAAGALLLAGGALGLLSGGTAGAQAPSQHQKWR